MGQICANGPFYTKFLWYLYVFPEKVLPPTRAGPHMPAGGFSTVLRPGPMCIPMGFHLGARVRSPYLKGEFLYFITWLSAWFPCSAHLFIVEKVSVELSSSPNRGAGCNHCGLKASCLPVFPVDYCSLLPSIDCSPLCGWKKIKCFCFWISKIFVTLHLWKVAGRSLGYGTEDHVARVRHWQQHCWNKKNICNGIYVKRWLRQTRSRT